MKFLNLLVLISSINFYFTSNDTNIVRKRDYNVDFKDYCKPVQAPAQIICNKAKDIGTYVQNFLSQSEDEIKNILSGLGLAFCIVDKTPILNTSLEQVCQVYGLKDQMIHRIEIENFTIEQFDKLVSQLNDFKIQYKNNSIILSFLDEIIIFITQLVEKMKVLEDENARINLSPAVLA